MITPYLNYNGNCEEAFKLYQKVLGGKLDIMKMKDAPADPNMPVPASDQNLVMHARLVSDKGMLMGSDTLSSMKFNPMHGFAIALDYPTADEAKNVFATLAEGGKVGMPIGETFWAGAFGMVTDRFGTPWMVNGAMRMQ
jgi:PhnB protein